MAKGIYVGAGGVARRMKKAYVGVAGKASAVRKMYVGVGNRARLCYSAEPEYAGTGVPLAAPKYGAKAAAAGNYALIGGGRFAGTASNAVCNTVDAYDTSLTRTARWGTRGICIPPCRSGRMLCLRAGLLRRPPEGAITRWMPTTPPSPGRQPSR